MNAAKKLAKDIIANYDHPLQRSTIKANARRLCAGLPVNASAGASSTVPDEMNVAVVTSTTPSQLAPLNAIGCAFSRKMHHV